jgi:hypothetical protein
MYFIGIVNSNLGSAMIRATSDNMECGMWNVK